MMTKVEAQNRLCILACEVSQRQFGTSEVTDCFCDNNHLPPEWNYSFSEKVMAFIENAVKDALAKNSYFDQDIHPPGFCIDKDCGCRTEKW